MMAGKRIWHHPWTVALCNIALMMGLYSISRIAYYVINRAMFPGVSGAHLWEMMAGGMRFDLTAILYLSSVYLLLTLLPLPCRQDRVYQKVCKCFYLVPNILGIAANCIDTVYTRFTDRRTTISFFHEFENDTNLVSIFCQAMVQYWYVTVLFIAQVALLVWLYRKVNDSAVRGCKVVYYVHEAILMLVSIYFIVIGIRGGFGAYTRPITLSNALQYTNVPQETNIVLNTPFALMRSTEGAVYEHPHYFGDDELPNRMTPVHIPDSGQVALRDGSERLNVVVIIMESFSKEYIGFFNRDLDSCTYVGYTPFLDSLLAHSITYKHSFAAGRKSIDAMPSVLSSIPMFISPYVLTPYSTNAVMSLASCLGPWGYETAFFHGAPNGSMGFEAYARSAGFAKYYGMDEYDGEDAFDGTWAIWDEPFLQYYGRTMSKMHEPFMTAVFTASSHHPFRIPAGYEGMFPTGDEPIHACVGYSDYALKRFFAYASTQAWYDHTLFVITADHTNQLTHPVYTTAKGIFEVPIAFYCPRWQRAQLVDDEAVSQIDIMPSVLSCLGYDAPYMAFGEDALTRSKQHPWAICYNHPMYQIMSDRLVLLFDGQSVTAVYDYVEDPLLEINHVADYATREDVQAMTTYLKATIQQYIVRMTHNELTLIDHGSTR